MPFQIVLAFTEARFEFPLISVELGFVWCYFKQLQQFGHRSGSLNMRTIGRSVKSVSRLDPSIYLFFDLSVYLSI